MPPLYSTLTLIAELGVSAIVYFAVYQGFQKGKFPTKLVAFALLYEVIFNISYMVSRVPSHVRAAAVEKPWITGLAIVHGVLSLLMFIFLIVFFVLAWKNYRRGINFFKNHSVSTYVFLALWTCSVLSGILFYFVEYIL